MTLATEVADSLRGLRTLNAASLRALRREVSRQVASEPASAVIDLAQQIIEEDPPGAYAFVYEVIYYHPTALSRLRAGTLQRLGRNMRGWGDVDAFAGLAGVAWRQRQISDKVIHRWARSRNRWWRRAALVSTVPLNVNAHGGQGDARRTLAVCRLLLEDRDDMVVKAMSWALRALSVWEPQVVEQFVDEHEDLLARRVMREVWNKLRTGRKDGRP